MVNINVLDSNRVHMEINITVAIKINFIKATNSFLELDMFGYMQR